jgi:hypothetical protein
MNVEEQLMPNKHIKEFTHHLVGKKLQDGLKHLYTFVAMDVKGNMKVTIKSNFTVM